MHSRHFLSSATWNLLGTALPLVVGLVCIPPLIKALGVERFGLLNLAWILVGYFSLFDFGISRALTRTVSEHLAQERAEDIPPLVASAIGIMRWFGLIAAVLLTGASFWIADWFHVSASLRSEVQSAFVVMALTLPFVLLSAGWRGVMEAYGRFDLVNWVRIPLGIALFGAPLLGTLVSDGLVPAVVSLSVVRVLGWRASRYFCIRLNPGLVKAKRIDPQYLRPLISFGGWMTVSNIIGPLMVYADRFLIGGLLSATAVAYYVTPYEMVTRLWIVPAAVTSVVFPYFSGNISANKHGAHAIYRYSFAIIFWLLLPAVALIYLFSYEGLLWWLGADFATHGIAITRLLAVGVFVNALGQISISVLHGGGRADWAAKLHLLELPLYIATLFYSASHFGIFGVAGAWLARMCLDTVAMFFLVERLLERKSFFAFASIGAILLAMGAIALAGQDGSNPLRHGVLLLACASAVAFLPSQLKKMGRATSFIHTTKDTPQQ